MMYDIQQVIVFEMPVFSMLRVAKIQFRIKKAPALPYILNINNSGHYWLAMKADITFLVVHGFNTNLFVNTILRIKTRFK